MPPSPEAQANPSTSSDQLLAFVHYLRGKKIPVSPADTLDAIEVVDNEMHIVRVLFVDAKWVIVIEVRFWMEKIDGLM